MSRTKSVVYLMSGPDHLPYLVVSLSTLRQHYDGPIKVYAYPESIGIVRRIALDMRLKISVELWEPQYRGKNGQFINKQQVMLDQPAYQDTVYLDADTIVCHNLDGLFYHLEHSFQFVATQFCNWESNVGVVRNRIKRLIGRLPIDQEAVETVLCKPYPSVNGGVFGCRSESKALQEWYEWTVAVKDIFIADETCLHAIMAKYLGLFVFGVRLGDEGWNSSPKFVHPDAPVRIWHGHGDCFLRPNKCKVGPKLWWPLYQEALAKNMGGIAEWRGQITYSYLEELEKVMF